MSKKRIYELARELGIENKEILAHLEKIGISVRSHASVLEDSDVERVKRTLRDNEPHELVEERIKATVIRRRTVHAPVEEPKAPVIEKKPPAKARKGKEAPAPKEAVVTQEPAKQEPVAGETPVQGKAPAKAARPEVIAEKELPEQKLPKEQIPPAKKIDKAADVAPAKRLIPEEKKKVTEGKPVPDTRPLVRVVEKEAPARPKYGRPVTRKDVPQRTGAGVAAKAAVTPTAESLKRAEEEKARKKPKAPVEILMEEQPPVKKKVFIKKIFEKKFKQEEVDLEERKPSKWREMKKPAVIRMQKTAITVPKAVKRRIKVGKTITVGELSKKMGIKASEAITKLIGLGLMATINQAIDIEVATLIAIEFGYQVEPAAIDYDEGILNLEASPDKLKPRAPVVTVMGHVDHGKTSLLDAIRKTNVIGGEVGGITQAIGAYHVHIKNRDIVFLDTPGHEAFTAMRARGAKMTDIVVLVVAADDGVMEQTIEAINHSRSADVPIIVAINKIDKPGADPGKIKQTLTEYNLVSEEWGGDTIFCEISAKKKQGIEELLEMILLQADMMDLKADPDRHARGVVIEAKLDRGRGPVATILIQEGTLREGDAFVSKTEYGRVRAMNNDQGRRVKSAGPSMPVEVIGFSKVPQVGTEFVCLEDEKKTRSIAGHWIRKERERELSAYSKITLEQLYQKIKEGVKDFNVIVKGDVQGSVEVLTESLNKLSTADVKLRIIHASTGAITETDVMLASASNAIIIGFNVRPDSRVADVAGQEGVEIKLYDIIYNVISDVKAAMEGLLTPVYRQVTQGRAEIRQLFKIPKVGTIAGSYVMDGKITRNSQLKLVRDGVVVYDGKILSVRRVKDDAKEVAAGFECGIGIDGYNDLRVGDIIESYINEEVGRNP
jgi:translation initiation factor IF-2